MITLSFYTSPDFFKPKYKFEGEEWREYKGYWVSNWGRVMLKKIQKVTFNPSSGYAQVKLSGVTYSLKRLVALVFVPNISNSTCVIQTNGNILDCRSRNLQWGKQTYKPGYRGVVNSACNFTKLTEKQVIEIINSPAEPRRLAKVYNVHRNTITHIQKGRSWKHLHEAIQIEKERTADIERSKRVRHNSFIETGLQMP